MISHVNGLPVNQSASDAAPKRTPLPPRNLERGSSGFARSGSLTSAESTSDEGASRLSSSAVRALDPAHGDAISREHSLGNSRTSQELRKNGMSRQHSSDDLSEQYRSIEHSEAAAAADEFHPPLAEDEYFTLVGLSDAAVTRQASTPLALYEWQALHEGERPALPSPFFEMPIHPAMPYALRAAGQELHTAEHILAQQGIAKKLHFVWFATKSRPLSFALMSNVLHHAMRHPTYETIIWVDDPKVINSVHPPLDKALDITPAMESLLKASKIKISTAQEFKELFETPPDPDLLRHVVESAFNRERRGAFANLASAADIVRLLALYKHGGIYLDVDTKTPFEEHPTQPSTALIGVFPEELTDKQQLYVGRGTPGLGHIANFNNDVLAAPENSHVIRRALVQIAKSYSHRTRNALPSPTLSPKTSSDRYLAQLNPGLFIKDRDAVWDKKRFILNPMAVRGGKSYTNTYTRPGLTMRITGPDMLCNVVMRYLRLPPGQEGRAAQTADAIDFTVSKALGSMVSREGDASAARWADVPREWRDDNDFMPMRDRTLGLDTPSR